jgi:hypothetical protein
MTRVAFILFLSCASVSCAVRDFVPYPNDWPKRLLGLSCAQMSGRYANSAIALSPTSTERGSQLPNKGFLSAILELGSLAFFDQRQFQISSVEIETDGRIEVTLYFEDSPAGLRVPFDQGWGCNKSGGLERPFLGELESEGSVGNAYSKHVTITRAEDGSLVVHILTENSATFPLGIGRDEEWARFQLLK